MNQDPDPTKTSETDARVSEIELGEAPAPSRSSSDASAASDLQSSTKTSATNPRSSSARSAKAVKKRHESRRAAGSSTSSPETRPHSKAPLIAGIVLGILVLVGAGFFSWYFFLFSQPDRVALDAMNHLFNAQNVALEGSVVMTAKDADSADGLQTITLDLHSNSDHLPATSTAGLKIAYANGDVIDLNLGAVVMQDGVLYFRIGGIMDALESAGLTEDERADAEVFFETLEIIDDEWWQISIPDLLAGLELDAAASKQLNSAYDCYVDYLGSDLTAELGTIYREHQFLSIENTKGRQSSAKLDTGIQDFSRSGTSEYAVDLNFDTLADFVNQIPETASAEDFYACLDKALPDAHVDTSNIPEVSADELKELLQEDTELRLYITDWTHRLRYLTLERDNDDYLLGAQLEFIYQDFSTETPENYRPITELFDQIMEIIVEVYGADSSGVTDEDFLLINDNLSNTTEYEG